ncbi:MAG: serine/threonine protein kinase [Myxococcales bacterium]|nr:serine/threonine protein kinase [Myxococcales bacterium]HRC55319.1 serine/threonine-protein kinase [Kofleriaceae bacterium]
MNQDRWRRIEGLFDEALELPEDERVAFLHRACADAPTLQRELSAMVAGIPQAGESLRAAVATEVCHLAAETVTGLVGRRIGPFLLTKLLGEGGMGAVYLAERDPSEFTHRVAIKVLSHAMASPQAQARFRDERRILATLEHPNIVRLLDGGSTPDKQPYLVMEYIEGVAITTYARTQRLSVRACIALVRKVCAALQYAHQNLVIHRDIKPSNILVDAAGQPKILDFGIAKLLAPVPGLDREAQTRTGAALFTPEYASPEQARGDAVSTATDVHALGALLYELVTGRPPHRMPESALEMLRVICDEEPEPPSHVAPAELQRVLRGDLDNIILKALHKEPGRRYGSMEQLSEDLGRFLDGLPVAARTATLGYRAHKFLRRHQAAALAGGLGITLLLGATAVSVRQAQRADLQAAAARTERARAIDAAHLAQQEAERARAAELRVQAQLDQLTSEQAARAKAEAEAHARAREAMYSREQLQLALDKARIEKLLAQDESQRAKDADARARAATHSERSTREECFRAVGLIPEKKTSTQAGTY